MDIQLTIAMATLRVLLVISLLQIALVASEFDNMMLDEWTLATQNARRAILAGNVEDMKRIAEVAAIQFKEFESLLEGLRTQLLAQVGSSKESPEALEAVEQQQKKYTGKELSGLDQVNLNLKTVNIIMDAHTLAPTAISWESVDDKLSSLLEQLMSAGLRE